MNITLKQLLTILAVGVFSVGLFFASVKSDTLPQSSSIPPSSSAEPLPTPEPPKNTALTLVVAGDNLVHDNLYKQAANRVGGNGFDFRPVYAAIEPIVAQGDIAFVNQETPLAEHKFPLAGYPLFNSPDAVGHQLADLGFNAVTCANNHMLDKGETGLLETLSFWEQHPEVLHFGAWRSEEEMQTPAVIEKNGIRIAFVPILEHTNGLSLPQGSSVRFLKTTDTEQINEQVALARENADFVAVSVHWGNENVHTITAHQKHLTEQLAAMGVDLIIGHHSHTIQPMEWYTAANGNRTLVFYSLGNLVSSMLDPQNMLGTMAVLQLEKDAATGETSIIDVEAVPTVTHYDGAGRGNVRIYPYTEYSDELAAKHGMKINFPYFGMSYMKEIILNTIPEEFRKNLPQN